MIAEKTNQELRGAIITARDNIGSLMAAYPDRFPRHAFQGTYDLLCEAVGTYDEVPTLPLTMPSY